MTQTTTMLDGTDPSVKIGCHRCHTRYRVRHPHRLTTSARSTCSACGAQFAVVSLRPVSAIRTVAVETAQFSEHPHLNSTDLTSEASTPKLCSFHGSGGTLLGMQVVNIFLSLATLGVYHFWGKAKIRRYLFSQTNFGGDRFAYHGTGKELYHGFLKAMLVFGIPYVSLGAARRLLTLPTWIGLLLQTLAALVLFLYVPIAIVNARRYRCTRTSWRGIRFSFRGETNDFLALYFRGWFFTFLTLGTYYPYFQTQRQAFLNSHTYFGNRRFDFSGHGSGLMVPFAMTLFMTYAVLLLCGLTMLFQLTNAGLTLLLIPFVLVPTWIGLLAQKQKYFWDHTLFGEARFASEITWQKLVTLYVGNLALLLITLGFAWPWVMVRNARFFTNNLSLQGPANFGRVLQETTASSVAGEGLSNLLDTGFDMD